ncbi:hypothetical protein [Brevibacillus parabrevis]|uniref:Uncharacterized protein n=1 Tax=Brevibacillus parabrevis TaxID=54914 RepID=A0A4Y3PNN1_BREPA|nr:hypothetical protein [Brevibacillus parabrevis]RNB90759.1 hypothetical protein EDM60_27830 [Brevibacillus parabrevis]GEB34937.1 hypothetical protein BPA01_45170 [Brevibacillus parabrevis]
MAMPQPRRTPARKTPFLNHLELRRAPKSHQQNFLRVKQSMPKQDMAVDKYEAPRPKRQLPAKSKSQSPVASDVSRQARKVGKAFGKKTAPIKPPKIRTPLAAPDPLEELPHLDSSSLLASEPLRMADSGAVTAPVRGQQETGTAANAGSSSSQVVFADVAYTEQGENAYVQVSILEEAWEVNWVHPIHAHWQQEWLEIHPKISLDVQETRHESNGRVVWVRGDFELTVIGTTSEAGKVAHETLRLPFTSTVLRPPVASEKQGAGAFPDNSPLASTESWIETGDWKASLMSEPFMKKGAGTSEYNGVAIVSGRIWWFRKQLIPLRHVGQD